MIEGPVLLAPLVGETLVMGKEAPGNYCCSSETKDTLEHTGLTLPPFDQSCIQKVLNTLCQTQ